MNGHTLNFLEKYDSALIWQSVLKSSSFTFHKKDRYVSVSWSFYDLLAHGLVWSARTSTSLPISNL